ncbi:spore cortex protein CoxA [Fictibacillus macauensis ZFHKF-1]|uniref:Spore cortex protein CoxA n=1 Tax=Fictibacillus macauensis ZFHKF-1 TaxID=1196324 RepID=I8J0N5_9BACL|nr:YhcN/YlaJ family sporulation lipoprotein [Fictibacillus macauensis]EIT85321.1 spore cortex protein CoxA [Fictibacillus macauensis ZFHKF-1]
MNKKIISGMAVLTLACGLVGCNKKGALDRNNNNDVRPIGYYSNHKDNMNDGNMMDYNNQNVVYHKNYNGALDKKITKRVNHMRHIDDAHVIIRDNNVIVGFMTSDKNTRHAERMVYRKVKDIVPNMKVHVTANRSIVSRIKNVDLGLTNGRAADEFKNDFKSIMTDIGKAGSNLGKAVKRPFENNR